MKLSNHFGFSCIRKRGVHLLKKFDHVHFVGEVVFLQLCQLILSLCVEKGIVSDKRQAEDSAFIKANARMDTLLEKKF